MASFPPLLSPGDTIALVAPAKYIEQNEGELTARYLNSIGYKTVFSNNLYAKNGYLAGEDQIRAANFTEAWCNPEIKMLWCVRGGFGSTRILEYLDYKKLRSHHKILVGMSDITALHCALQKELDIITYLGPMPYKLLITAGDAAEKEHSLKHLWSMIQGAYSLADHTLTSPHLTRTLVAGISRGKLVGGNLSLIASLIGTPWQLETQGKILLLEDVNEEPYRIDRMLRQLKQSGALQAPAGVILASWKGCAASSPSQSLTLDEIFDSYFKNESYPSFIGYPSGHTDAQLTLPLNAMVELNSNSYQINLIDSY
ncbi:MAG: LD-carboxypeptidase [Parachlamydiales bacterium]|jgi:muramoyltetrapeptide carboxypeptidase